MKITSNWEGTITKQFQFHSSVAANKTPFQLYKLEQIITAIWARSFDHDRSF